MDEQYIIGNLHQIVGFISNSNLESQIKLVLQPSNLFHCKWCRDSCLKNNSTKYSAIADNIELPISTFKTIARTKIAL